MGFHGISWNDPTMQTGGCPARFLAERTVSTEHLQKVARSASHRISGSHLETFSDHTFFFGANISQLVKDSKDGKPLAIVSCLHDSQWHIAIKFTQKNYLYHPLSRHIMLVREWVSLLQYCGKHHKPSPSHHRCYGCINDPQYVPPANPMAVVPAFWSSTLRGWRKGPDYSGSIPDWHVFCRPDGPAAA